MVQDEASSSSVTSSPLQCFSKMPFPPPPYAPWLLELRSDERGLYLIHLLLNCAAHVAAGRLDHANAALEHTSLLASPDGDAMQRIATHFTDALARRALRSWPGLYRALSASPRPPPPAEAAAARRLFLDLCPFLRLAFAAANQAILEAMEGEKMVHIVDLNAGDPTQWAELLHLLAVRPGGPPHLRITGVHEHKEVLAHTAMYLTKEAERLDIPFQFHSIVSPLDSLDVESLRVKTGEAVAVNSVLQLHYLLAADDAPIKNPGAAQSQRDQLEKDPHVDGYRRSPDSGRWSPSPPSPRIERFLASLWSLSPKVMVVTEQESSHNGAALTERFVEALNFYAALFDCLEMTAPRSSAGRACVERVLLGEEIKNILVCEGAERRERHEKLERWARRLDAACFGRVPLSYVGLLEARRLLQGFGCEGYNVREENGCFFICWQDRALFSVSAWRCRRFD